MQPFQIFFGKWIFIPSDNQGIRGGRANVFYRLGQEIFHTQNKNNVRIIGLDLIDQKLVGMAFDKAGHKTPEVFTGKGVKLSQDIAIAEPLDIAAGAYQTLEPHP